MKNKYRDNNQLFWLVVSVLVLIGVISFFDSGKELRKVIQSTSEYFLTK